MAISTFFEWLLRVGSVGGAASFGWQVYNAWAANRGRLAVATQVSINNHFGVDVSYRARDHHIGLSATLTVTTPPTAKVFGIRRRGEESLLAVITAAVDQSRAEASAKVRLLHLPTDGEGVYGCSFEVVPPLDAPPEAIAIIEIWTAAFPKRLLRRRLKLSPINERDDD